ncbi:MAG TPA: hypothetical protein VF151_10735 [Gemmatimonadales bacterium]
MQFVDGNQGTAIDFCPSLLVVFGMGPTGRTVVSATIDSGDGHVQNVPTGSYIVRQGNGTFEVVPENQFKRSYQPV